MYTSQQGTAYNDITRPGFDPRAAGEFGSFEFSALLDPSILQGARQIYRTYYEVHPEQVQKPIGVAIDRFSYRGKLIFGSKPVLLPQECFVPLNQIEAELY
uniref:hypothetical protein n=1 Tax=Oculatella sp. LEGE 06141 TaxID=1828648 RepID=UPI0030D7AECF